MAEQSHGLLHSDDDTVLSFGEDSDGTSRDRKLKFPGVAFFTVIFRALAIVLYLFAGVFGMSFITSFVLIVLLLSADFWTLKNISGRLLAGLRWWNYVDDQGESHWKYESRKKGTSAADSRIFWLALIISPVLWILFFFTSLISFSLNWLMVVCIALTLNLANLFGYLRCKMGSSDSMSDVTKNFFREKLLSNVMKSFASKPADQQTFNAPTREV